jgi:hypothetical protein
VGADSEGYMPEGLRVWLYARIPWDINWHLSGGTAVECYEANNSVLVVVSGVMVRVEPSHLYSDPNFLGNVIDREEILRLPSHPKDGGLLAKRMIARD